MRAQCPNFSLRPFGPGHDGTACHFLPQASSPRKLRLCNSTDRPVKATEGQGGGCQGSLVAEIRITHCYCSIFNSIHFPIRIGLPLTSRQKIDCRGFYEARGKLMTRKNCWPKAWWGKSRSHKCWSMYPGQLRLDIKRIFRAKVSFHGVPFPKAYN